VEVYPATAVSDTKYSSISGRLAVWEYQERHAGKLPQSEEEDLGELVEIAESMRKGLKINEKFMKEPPREVLAWVFLPNLASFYPSYPDLDWSRLNRNDIDNSLDSHLANGASHEFAPTAAILGGLLAQDILRALSRKEKPVMNFLAVETMAGTGTTTRWGMGVEQEV
jgi:ubiquitin-like 1-activating enzyme E1 A